MVRKGGFGVFTLGVNLKEWLLETVNHLCSLGQSRLWSLHQRYLPYSGPARVAPLSESLQGFPDGYRAMGNMH